VGFFLKKLFGWGSRERFMLRAGVPMAVVFLGAYFFGSGPAFDKGKWLFMAAIVSGGAFLAVFWSIFCGRPIN
jgi:hypothetical protein